MPAVTQYLSKWSNFLGDVFCNFGTPYLLLKLVNKFVKEFETLPGFERLMRKVSESFKAVMGRRVRRRWGGSRMGRVRRWGGGRLWLPGTLPLPSLPPDVGSSPNSEDVTTGNPGFHLWSQKATPTCFQQLNTQ